MTKCPICEMEQGLRDEIERQLRISIPPSDIVRYTASKGTRIAQKHLIEHKRHSAIHKPSNTSQESPQPPVPLSVPSLCDEGLKEEEREERLMLLTLDATERMYYLLRQTESIKAAKSFSELAALSASILRTRIDREEPPDTQVILNIVRHRAEDVLPECKEM